MSAPTNDDSHLWVTWDDYNRLIERLALQVHQSGWQFDKIFVWRAAVCVSAM